MKQKNESVSPAHHVGKTRKPWVGFPLYLAIALATLGVPVAHAQVSQSWSGTPASTNWNTFELNWDTGIPWTNNNNAIFGGTATGVAVTEFAVVFNDITFNSSYLIVDGGGSLLLGDDQASQISVANGITAQIGSLIADNWAGVSSLTLPGPGTLILTNGNNQYSGNITVNGGMLSTTGRRIGANCGLGSTSIAGPPRYIYVNNGATLFLNALDSFTGGNNELVYPEVVLTGSTMAVNTNGTAAWNNTVGNIVLDGSQILLGAGHATRGTIALSGVLSVIGTSPSTISSVPGKANSAVALGSHVAIDRDEGATINVANVTGDSAADLIISSVVRNPGDNFSSPTNPPALTKIGAGTLRLEATNTYAGKTVINVGTVALTSAASISNSSVIIAAGATFDVTTKSGYAFLTNNLNPNKMVGSGSTSGAGSFNLGSAKALTLGLGVRIASLSDGTSVGKVTVTGDVVLNNNAVVVDVNTSPLGAGTYTLLDCTGTLTGSAASSPTMTGLELQPGFQASVVVTAGSGGKVDLVVVPVPAAFSAYKIQAASLTPTAGTADLLTITAVDSSGATVTGFHGQRALTFSGLNTAPNGAQPTVTDLNGTAVTFGTPTTLSFVNGVALATSGASSLVPKNAETVAIHVSDSVKSDADAGGSTVTLTVLPAADSAYRIVTANDNPTTGDNVALTINIVDNLWNVSLFNGNKTMTFNGLSASDIGTQPTVNGANFGTGTIISFTAGTANATLIPRKNEGPVNLTASSASPTLTTATNGGGLSPIMFVNLGAATQVRVESSDTGSAVVGAQIVGTANSITVYANSRDSSGNFVANASADAWSMVNETGGVADTDLSPVSGLSSVFTGATTGSGNIRASVAGLTSVDSGTITVQCLTAATSSPGNRMAELGTPATFTVISPSSGPTYQWQIDTGSGFVPVNGGLGVDSGGDGSGGLTANFSTVPTTAGMQGYKYRCVVSVACDASSITSGFATLYVADPATTSFRSKATGLWGTNTTWEASADNGANWVQPDFLPTDANNTNITVRSPHSVTVAADASADQTIVNAGATLVINGGNLTIADGAAAYDMDVAGELRLASNNPLLQSGALRVSGSYVSSFSNGPPALPTASLTTWADGSLAKIADTLSSGTTTAIGVAGHNFYNFTVEYLWNRRLVLGITGNDTKVRNNFNINIPTSGASLGLTGLINPAPGTCTLTVDGNATFITGGQTTGTKILLNSGNDQTNYFKVKGDFVCQGVIDTFGNSYTQFEMNGTGAQLFTIPSGANTINDRLNLHVEATSIVTLGNAITKNTEILVKSGGRLNCGTNEITGVGIGTFPSSFTLESGATLGIGSPAGIAASGASGNIQTVTRTFNTGANYIYTGAANQVLGSGLPATVNNLTLATSMTNSVTVTNTVPNTTPKYTVTSTLTANNNVIAYSVSGPALAAGSYALYSYGTLSGTFASTPVLVSGSTEGSPVTVSAGGGTVNLVVPTSSTPPTLNVSRSGNTLSFSWTGAFKLQSQTNSLSTGISANWFDYPDANNPVNVNINPANPTVFFRLVNQ